MRCKNCGAKIEDDSRFCAYCGTAFGRPKNTSATEGNDFISSEFSFDPSVYDEFLRKEEPEERKPQPAPGRVRDVEPAPDRVRDVEPAPRQNAPQSQDGFVPSDFSRGDAINPNVHDTSQQLPMDERGLWGLFGTNGSQQTNQQMSPNNVFDMRSNMKETGQTGAVSGQKSRALAGLMQIFFGGLGIGRFYLGYTQIGMMQMLLTCAGGIGLIWGFFDGLLILAGIPQNDANGVPLK